MLSMLIENVIKVCRQIVQVFRIERCDKHFLKTLKHFFQCFVVLNFQVFDLFTGVAPRSHPGSRQTQLLSCLTQQLYLLVKRFEKITVVWKKRHNEAPVWIRSRVADLRISVVPKIMVQGECRSARARQMTLLIFGEKTEFVNCSDVLGLT